MTNPGRSTVNSQSTATHNFPFSAQALRRRGKGGAFFGFEAAGPEPPAAPHPSPPHPLARAAPWRDGGNAAERPGTTPGKKDYKFWAGQSPSCGGRTRNPSGARSPPSPGNAPAISSARGTTRAPGPEPRAAPPGRTGQVPPPLKLGRPGQDPAPPLFDPAPPRHRKPGAESPPSARPLPAPGRGLLPLPAPRHPRHKRATARAEPPRPRRPRATSRDPACRARGGTEPHPRTMRTPSARARCSLEHPARGFSRPGPAHAPHGALGALGPHPGARLGRAPRRPSQPRPSAAPAPARTPPGGPGRPGPRRVRPRPVP